MMDVVMTILNCLLFVGVVCSMTFWKEVITWLTKRSVKRNREKRERLGGYSTMDNTDLNDLIEQIIVALNNHRTGPIQPKKQITRHHFTEKQT